MIQTLPAADSFRNIECTLESAWVPGLMDCLQ